MGMTSKKSIFNLLSIFEGFNVIRRYLPFLFVRYSHTNNHCLFIRDGRQLEESVSKTLGWIQGELGELAGRLLVSADKEKLRQQLERHGPAYREAMAKEHEVIMLLNKGKILTLFGRPFS